ncbi:MAG: hypothetical protein JWQ38_35 [Flavipsychrobacter sp.]|nr:hypothetical protein [Flavipsychrobacter sp.]
MAESKKSTTLDEGSGNRVPLIRSVSTPLQFATLIVLVVESLLALLLSKAQTDDIPLYVGLMCGILVLLIVSIFILEYKKLKLKSEDIIPDTGKTENQEKTFKYDVFLAAPMAALGSANFKDFNDKVKEIMKILEADCGFPRIFFAGKNMTTMNDFDTPDVSVDTDINALRDSRIFIMIYPEKIVSSVLYEAGIALALGKPSFYFGHIDNFPFLMKQANQKFSHVKIQEADTLDKTINMLKINKAQLFTV